MWLVFCNFKFNKSRLYLHKFSIFYSVWMSRFFIASVVTLLSFNGVPLPRTMSLWLVSLHLGSLTVLNDFLPFISSLNFRRLSLPVLKNCGLLVGFSTLILSTLANLCSVSSLVAVVHLPECYSFGCLYCFAFYANLSSKQCWKYWPSKRLLIL